MERLTETYRNSDGTGVSKKRLVYTEGLKKGLPNGYCGAIVTKLADYEDAEEQGLLLRLPKEFSNIDKRIIEYSLVKAMNLVRYGIEVDDRLENATQISCAINQAYMMGRQEERNRFRELRKEEAEQKLAEMRKE